MTDAFNTRWGDMLPVAELVLEGQYGSSNAVPISKSWAKSLYPADLLTYLREPGAWGSRLVRVRIDYIPIIKLEAKCLSDPAYSNLKILMLQPLEKLTDEEKIIDREEISEPECYNLACNILGASLPGLKLVVIRSYWYWLSRECKKNEIQVRTWRWNDATMDP